MKKITLALFAVVSAFGSAFGQANITFTTPIVNASTQVRLPDGTDFGKSLKGCMLIKQNELTALTGSIVNSIGMILLDGTDPQAAVGNFTVYVSNTADVNNTKAAAGYASAISNMTMVYNGAITIPTVAATVLYTLNCTPQFTYTGGGLYICYQYEQTSATSNTWSATWAANNAGAGNALGASSSGTTSNSAPDALTSTDFRPSWIFRAANTATNEVGVVSVLAPGKVAKLNGTGHTVAAVVKNGSIGTLNNIVVNLNVGGANSFSDTKTITTLAPGAVQTVSFNTFNPLTNGINNLSVTTGSDQNPANNLAVWTQSVSCDQMATNPPNPTFASSFGFGGTGSGIFAVMHNVAVNASLTAIRFGVGAATQNAGKQLYGVLMDNSGTIMATSNTITLSNANLGAYVNFVFQKEPLAANTDYLFGVAQPVGGYYPLASINFTQYPIPFYYSVVALAGGAPTPITNITGFFAIEPQMIFSGYEITAAANKTVVCKGGTEAVSITVTGADSYTWNPPIPGSGPSFTWIPTVSGAGTATQIAVVGSYTNAQAAGCRSNSVALTFSLLTCTGVNEAIANANVKLYPNPAVSAKSTISGLEGVNTITVFNTLGQAVLKDKVEIDTYTLDMTDFPNGNYMVKITNAANESRTIKFVNQN